MKWSDGQPFTADDFMFWYEDIYLNKDLVPTPHAAMSINGKPGTIEKVDEHDRPLRLPGAVLRCFLDVLAGSHRHRRRTRYARRHVAGRRYAPAHYLKQFHPKYVGRGRASTRRPRTPSFDNWVTLLQEPATTGRSTPSCRS